MDLLVWIAAAAAACVGAWRVHRRRGRARQLMLLCHRADLEFSPIDPFPDTLWLPFRWLGGGRWTRAENVVWNRAHGDDVRVFDLLTEDEPSQGGGPRVTRRSVCAAVTLPFGCPTLEIRPREALDQVTDAITGTDVDRKRFQGASLDHSMWFHRPGDPGEWHWFDTRSHGLSGGRGLVTGDVVTQSGRQVATIAQQVLLRKHRTAG